ncbi:DNRLRE domain-containing protein [Nonomuraea pusilla]|uniref:DNRLRE domain-containing protein n=1 Tax=Nonomuraea pusilla TaxID=46177 RepID=UPI0033221553
MAVRGHNRNGAAFMMSCLSRLLVKALVVALPAVTLTAMPSPASAEEATLSIRPQTWAYVSSSEENKAHANEDGHATVGLQGSYTAPAQPESVRRSFFGYDVSALRGKTIVKAELTFVPVDHSCDNRIVGFSLWETGAVGEHTTWKHQPEWLRTLGATLIPWLPCSQQTDYWPFVMQPTASVAEAVAGESGLVTFGIQSLDEARPTGRLLLENNPELRITYEAERRNAYPKDPRLPLAALNPTAWAYAESGHQNVPHWNTGEPVPVGSPDGHRRHRSFFRFDLSALAGDRLEEARLWLSRADTCRPGEQPVEVWETGDISEETTWHRQPQWLRRLDAYTWQSCEDSGASLILDVTEAIRQAGQDGRASVTIGLRSAAEDDPLGWYSLDNGPRLDVSHLPPLSKPSDLVTDNSDRSWPAPLPGRIGPFPCVRGEARPYIPYAPRPEANVPGGADLRWARWQWQTLDGEPVHEERNGPGYGRAYGPRWGSDGVAYRWRVRSEDVYQQVSEWSDWCEYVVDTTKPGRPAAVSGTPYLDRQPAGGPGVPGRFTFAPNGVTDVAGYYYRFSGDASWTWVPAEVDGSATVTWTPPGAASYELAVVSVDRATNRAPSTASYHVVVADGA